MRVTHQYRYDFFISNMNRNLSELMTLNQQAASQKKINRPSDDPVGMSKILASRDSMRSFDRYQKNIDTAKGWLGLADKSLIQVNTLLTRLNEIAEQAATGTMSADNREEVSYEARQILGQLLNIANAKQENKHIFAGHKVAENPFKETLWMSTNDSNVADSTFSIAGSSSTTILVRFLDDGTIGGGAPLDYEYSTDGGKTFTTATLGAANNVLDLGGVQMTMENGTAVAAYDPGVTGSAGNGTWMWIRPSVEYVGDDMDGVETMAMTGSALTHYADGNFSRDVVVRIDDDSNLASNISYSYSLDGGINWVTGQNKPADGTASSASIVIPGGYLVLGSNAGNTVSAGDQFVVRPHSAAIYAEVSPNSFVQMNESGKDIFGGVYNPPGGNGTSPVFADKVSQNLFETVGKLIGYLETNNQDGVQQSLENLRDTSQHVLNRAARIGARENRLDVSESMLQALSDNEEERLSFTEDIDITELMTNLASQEIAYQTVLRSSSNIMRMSLVNYM